MIITPVLSITPVRYAHTRWYSSQDSICIDFRGGSDTSVYGSMNPLVHHACSFSFACVGIDPSSFFFPFYTADVVIMDFKGMSMGQVNRDFLW